MRPNQPPISLVFAAQSLRNLFCGFIMFTFCQNVSVRSKAALPAADVLLLVFFRKRLWCRSWLMFLHYPHSPCFYCNTHKQKLPRHFTTTSRTLMQNNTECVTGLSKLKSDICRRFWVQSNVHEPHTFALQASLNYNCVFLCTLLGWKPTF